MGVSDVAEGCLLPHVSGTIPVPLLQPDDTQRHSKLSGYLYRKKSWWKPNNDIFLKGGLFKYQFWLYNEALWTIPGWITCCEFKCASVHSKVCIKLVCYLIGAGWCVSVGLFFITLSRGWAGELCPLLDNIGNKLWRLSAQTVCKSLK